MNRKIAIIGFGSAGFASLMAIKKTDPHAEVTLIDPKPYDLFHPCGIPYAVEGIVSLHSLMQNVAIEKMGVKKFVGRAEAIDWKNKRIYAHSERGDGVEIIYDDAIICTGSIPHIPPIRNINDFLKKGVYTLVSSHDVDAVNAAIAGANSAIIIGGGAIGLEAAVALKKRCAHVTVFEMKPQLLPGVLDSDMSRLVENHLAALGIECALNAAVEEIVGETSCEGIIASGNFVATQICMIATGFLPNDEIAIKSGITTEKWGIVVDSMLCTSAPHVYAAGDCIAAWSCIDGKKIPVKLATSAYKQGTIAGENASGKKRHYKGTAGTFVTKLGDLEVAGTGYSSEAAFRAGYTPIAGKITSRVVPDYFPAQDTVTVKVISDKKTGKLLGAQAVGHGAA
ncbi:MAG: FAD-dependent oxidoreductase [Spirochaetes bacterium]|nr:FAD-dependent oxidoreductase [Spirochaetota bacterium]